MLLMLSVTACGGNGGNSSAATDAPASADPAAGGSSTAQPAGKAKIKFYTFKADKPEEPIFQAVQAYNAAQDKVEVEYESLVQNSDSTDFMKKLDILVAGGEVVDVFMTGNEDELLERASRGVVEPLNSFLNRRASNPRMNIPSC
ncbi:hypothetical protein ACFTAO_14220 [Paenibacillus rhizoplanae]